MDRIQLKTLEFTEVSPQRLNQYDLNDNYLSPVLDRESHHAGANPDLWYLHMSLMDLEKNQLRQPYLTSYLRLDLE